MEPLLALGLASNIVQIADFSGRMISRSKEIHNSANGALSIHTYLEDAARNLEELSRDLVGERTDTNAFRQEAADAQIQKERRDAKLLWQVREKAFKKKAEEEAKEKIKDAGRQEGLPKSGKIIGGRVITKEDKKKKQKQKDELEKMEAEERARADEEQKKIEADTQQMRTAEQQLVTLSTDTKRITKKIIDVLQKLKSDDQHSKFQSVRQAFRSVWSESQIKSLETDLDNIRKQTDTALLFSVRKRLDELNTKALPRAEGDILDCIREFDSKYGPTLDAISNSARINSLESRDSELRNTASARSTGGSKTMNNLAEKMETLVQSQLESRFRNIIQARLKFADMPDRFERIPKTHAETFSWIYSPPELHPESGSWNNFTEWLGAVGEERLYWITGKPGSGKSTLMKFLYDQQQTLEALKPWSSTPVFHAGFFFWNSGTAMQMSREGLLQTLLLTLTQQIMQRGSDPRILEHLFSDRWDMFNAFSGGRSPFAWPELKRSFETLLADNSRNFFLAIDGLDEFDGNASEIIDFILQIAKFPNVKICTASRPWSVFEDAFHKQPSLLLENLTRKDIRDYVTSNFNSSRHYVRLIQHGSEGAIKLTHDIIKKASGVFLWVRLVVDSLLQGISNADNMSELQARLDALPTDLEELFDKLLEKVEPAYYRQACQLIQLIDEQTSPTLLQLSYADDEDSRSAMLAKTHPLTPDEIGDRVEIMERRLKSRCKCFLEVYEHSGTENEPSLTVSERMKVGFLHRTAKDYLRSDRIRAKIRDGTKDTSFNVCDRWANAFLWSLKTIEPKENNKVGSSPSFAVHRWYIWEPLTWCIEYALRLQKQDGKARISYLDEVGRVGIKDYSEAWRTKQVVAPGSYGSFLELMIQLNMEEYACMRLDTASKTELKQLLKAHAQHANLNNWLQGRHSLLDKLKLGTARDAQAIAETLRYRSKSTAHRAFSSKPKKMVIAYI